MKRNCIAFFVLVLFAFTSVFGQTKEVMEGVELTWGEVYEEDKGFSPQEVIGATNDRIFILKKKWKPLSKKIAPTRYTKEYYTLMYGKDKSVFHIHVHDKNGNFLLSKGIASPMKDEKMIFEKVMLLNNRLHLFTTFFDEKAKSVTLYAQEIDTNSLDLIGSPKKIMYIDKVIDESIFKPAIGNPMYNNTYFSPFWIAESPNKKSLAFFFGEPSGIQKSEKLSIEVNVYDIDLNLLYDTKIEINTDKKNIYNYSVLFVDDMHNVYSVLGWKNDVKKIEKQERKIEVYKYSKAKDKIIHYYVDLMKEKYVAEGEITISLSKNNELLIVGYYTDNPKNKRYMVHGFSTDILAPKSKEDLEINGIVYLRIKPDDEAGEYYLKNDEFPKKIYSEFMSDKKVENASGLPKISLSGLFVRHNGEACIIGENYSYFEPSSLKLKEDRFAEGEYSFLNFLATNISEDGELQWVIEIPRALSSYPRDFNLMGFKDRVYLLCRQQRTDLKKSGIGLTALSKDGSITDKILTDFKTDKIRLLAPLSSKISDNQFLIYATNVNNNLNSSKVGILTFK